MKRSLLLVATVLAAALAVPSSAFAFQITGGGGTQTQNPYGLWYAGQEACAQEGCHSVIAAKPTVHANMVGDTKTYPSQLIPSASSGLWPYSSPFGGLVIRPRDVYLRIGDPSSGFFEYTGFSGSALATTINPADDLPIWDPMEYEVAGAWAAPTSKVGFRGYSQSCSPCHNLGVTRPSKDTYTLGNGATETSTTPTTVSALSIQCEVCHGSGKNPSGHKTGVPAVVGGAQILKAQVCGQCHVTGSAAEKGVSGSAFGNPNGYTTDTTLSAVFTPVTTVESETAFMDYVNGKTKTKPKFLPNGADYSMRHDYYNEWLISGHGTSPRAMTVNNANPKCIRCHSGLGFLYRIGAKSPSGTRLVPTEPTTQTVAAADPGISCQVCHTGHVGYKPQGGFDSMRTWANGKGVSCGDCHNWRYETLDLPMQYETINGVEYTRPALNNRPHPAQREVWAGGYGGEDGMSGMWGVAPVGVEMTGVACKDCHMPRTHREGMPANDDGSTDATRMSHRFHIVEPGDAARWKLRPNGDSCVAGCHKQEAASYTRQDFQNWIDETSATIKAMSLETSVALGAVGDDFGFTRYRSFEATQPTTGLASTVPSATWAMLQHAAQNLEIVNTDHSNGLHNSKYAAAGLQKALLWAKSASATVDAALAAGPVDGQGMTVDGALHGAHGVAVPGAEVVLETSTDGGTAWAPVATASPDATTGVFAIPTGRIVGSRLYRVTFTPADGVSYASNVLSVQVPVTVGTRSPDVGPGAWAGSSFVTVNLSATPGSLTFYSLSGATTGPQTVYTGPFNVSAEGATNVRFWSSDANGIEAPNDLAVLIDRTTPMLACDAAGVYSGNAAVRVSAIDAGAGVTRLEYSLDGAPFVSAGNTWTVLNVSALGSHVVTARASDGSGKSAQRSWGFSVKAMPGFSAARSSVTVRAGRSWRARTNVTAGGRPVAGKRIVLQRSTNGRSWRTYATVVTDGAGGASRSVRFSTRGTTYWRWFCPEDGSYFSAIGGRTKVVVR